MTIILGWISILIIFKKSLPVLLDLIGKYMEMSTSLIFLKLSQINIQKSTDKCAMWEATHLHMEKNETQQV